MKILFKLSAIYFAIFTIVSILLGIYKLFELSYLTALFSLLIYVATIAIVVTLLSRYIDTLVAKLKPIIKFLKKWFK